MLRRSGLSIERKRVHRLMALEGLLILPHFHRPSLPPTGRLSGERPRERWYVAKVDTTDHGWCRDADT